MSSFRKPVQAYRQNGASVANGYVTSGVETGFSIRASVQPARPSDIEALPEGRRESTVFRLYTSTQMRMLPLSGEPLDNPDQVELYGDRFEIMGEANWQNNVINHYKYLAVKVGE